MKTADTVAETLTSFHWLLLPEFILYCLYYGNYRGRVRRHGFIIGILVELFRGLFTVNAYSLSYNYLESRWSGREVARFFSRNGVPTFTWTWDKGIATFHVPAHLSKRADYLFGRAMASAS